MKKLYIENKALIFVNLKRNIIQVINTIWKNKLIIFLYFFL